ncbi:MAG TPA: tetratricopeptide repeat protein [Sphingomicrobium sp.]|nr:tetratricopeptide repeat protein [Sphingomicrobium sp.]
MTKSFRFGSAISLVAVASMIAGCAAPQRHASSASSLGGKADGEVGLATRALAALAANDPTTAIDYAERAVDRTPNDVTLRALLGNAYFVGGRFASAEAAFKDALLINANQPQVILKLALVEIAQGRNAEALQLLDASRGVLDAADYGLALALAGRASDAVATLEVVARANGADSRVRQNLALAYAFSGDWTSARTVAAQDVPADQLDNRIHQWMQLAKPAHPSDQVAALIGVTPAAADPGQPTRLALRQDGTRQAEAVPAQQPQVAEATPPQAPAAPAPIADFAPPPPPVMAQAAPRAPAPAVFDAGFVEPPPARKAVVARRAPAPIVHAAFRNVPVRRAGNSSAVVQLGAFGSAERVAAAWNVAAHRFGSLKGYTPVSARFTSPKGTVYRLSVKGFSSDREARLVCGAVRNAGGTCFVRDVAGDRPVQLASR